jgi:hypothetical protein
MMNFEEALRFADELLLSHTGKGLSDAEKFVLGASLQNKSYEKMAADSDYRYTPSYLQKDVGPTLWTRLGKALGEPVKKADFQAALERRSHSEIEVPTPYLSRSSDEIHSDRGLYIPNSRCRKVWGRDPLIQEVLHRLCDPQELSILALSGGAGYGKTEAASQIAKAALHKNLFARVLWVTARHSEFVDGQISHPSQFDALNWTQFLNQIAHQLACPLDRVQQHLREQKHLVVLDNAETSQVEDILANLVKMLEPSRALLTSRLKTKPPYVGAIDIQGLEEKWSHQLLHDEAAYNKISVLLEASEAQLHRVHQLSCGAPLALHFIVGRVLDDLALDPVLSALEQASGEVEIFYQFSLETAWQRISDAGKKVLRYMGRSNAGVTRSEFLGAWGVSDGEWVRASRELRRWYLMENAQDAKGDRRYDLHPWVRNSLRGGLVEKWEPSLDDLAQIAKFKFDIEI